MNTYPKFENLNKDVQNEIKDALRAYSECKLWLNLDTGGYSIEAHTSISNSNTPTVLIGCYKASDVFTVEERIVNYVKSFRDFPYMVNGLTYEGTKDWKAINSKWTHVELDSNGDLIFS